MALAAPDCRSTAPGTVGCVRPPSSEHASTNAPYNILSQPRGERTFEHPVCSNGTCSHPKPTSAGAPTVSGLQRLPLADGIFTRVTTGDIATDDAKSRAAAFADFNHDGHLDVIVVNVGWNHPGTANFLYTGDGTGTLTRVTTGVVATDVAHSTAVAWADFDNDGYLDLVVANSCHPHVNVCAAGSDTVNHLYTGNGTGFTRVTTGAVATDSADSRGVAWCAARLSAAAAARADRTAHPLTRPHVCASLLIAARRPAYTGVTSITMVIWTLPSPILTLRIFSTRTMALVASLG